jgi:hypothetical protein
MKSTVVRNIAPCSPVKVNGRFGGTSPPSSGSNKPNKILAWTQAAYHCFHASTLLGLFYAEDEGAIFLRNVGLFAPNYMTLCPRIPFGRKMTTQTLTGAYLSRYWFLDTRRLGTFCTFEWVLYPIKVYSHFNTLYQYTILFIPAVDAFCFGRI